MTPETPERTLRIGVVAKRLGVTTRTIRYYEELGLLGAGSDRSKGAHRLYGEADIAHLAEVRRPRSGGGGARGPARRLGERPERQRPQAHPR
jgi:hypothetical protein